MQELSLAAAHKLCDVTRQPTRPRLWKAHSGTPIRTNVSSAVLNAKIVFCILLIFTYCRLIENLSPALNEFT